MKISASFPIPDNMLSTIRACTAGLGAVGIGGGLLGPGADLPVIAPTWIGMVATLAAQADLRLEDGAVSRLVMACASGCATFVAGTKTASTVAAWLFSPLTGGSSLALNCAANAALNAKLTHAFGSATARYFLQAEQIAKTDIAVGIIIALVGLEFGIPTPRDDIIR